MIWQVIRSLYLIKKLIHIFPLVDIIASIFIQPKQSKLWRGTNFRKRLTHWKTKTQTIKIHTKIRTCISRNDSGIGFKRVPSRLAVWLAKAKYFNETVSIDFHVTDARLCYFHVIDQFSKYINVAIIKNKSPTLKAFIKIWLSILGAPKKLFSDNGGEFISDKFYECVKSFV